MGSQVGWVVMTRQEIFAIIDFGEKTLEAQSLFYISWASGLRSGATVFLYCLSIQRFPACVIRRLSTRTRVPPKKKAILWAGPFYLTLESKTNEGVGKRFYRNRKQNQDFPTHYSIHSAITSHHTRTSQVHNPLLYPLSHHFTPTGSKPTTLSTPPSLHTNRVIHSGTKWYFNNNNIILAGSIKILLAK